MKINDEGLDIIRHFEGKQLKAYYCPAGILTIGYGHTGPDVFKGQKIDEEMADKLLLRDIKKFESCITRSLQVNVNQNQFSALVCLAFNIGCEAFWKSTLRRFINQKNCLAAAEEFLRWNKSKGKILPGLTERRIRERALFMKPVIVADNARVV